MMGKYEQLVCLIRVRKEMGRVKSGSEEREWTRMEREMELGAGLVRRAVRTRLMASGMLSDKHKRGIKRLILLSSCSVSLIVVLQEVGEKSGYNNGLLDDKEEK